MLGRERLGSGLRLATRPILRESRRSIRAGGCDDRQGELDRLMVAAARFVSRRRARRWRDSLRRRRTLPDFENYRRMSRSSLCTRPLRRDGAEASSCTIGSRKTWRNWRHHGAAASSNFRDRERIRNAPNRTVAEALHSLRIWADPTTTELERRLCRMRTAFCTRAAMRRSRSQK